MASRLVFMLRNCGVIFLLLLTCTASFAGKAVSDEEYWVKVNPIGKPPSISSAGYDLFESRLQNVKNRDLAPLDFFRQLGADRMSMNDVVAFKSEFIRRKSEELSKTRAISPLDALPEALKAWDGTFGQAERMLMDTRRRLVNAAFDTAVQRYLEANPDFPYLIRMDVGGWATENYRDGRFEGDIDLTTIASQVESAVKLRDFYNGAIHEVFDLDMAALEAHATAHRRATLDVYITQASAKWAEIDALKRGRLQEVVIENGQVSYRDVTDSMERIYIFANLQNNLQMREGAPDQLARLMDEPPDRITRDMEPAVSLEMLRHMTSDAIHAQLAFHEKLIKLAKYVDRSAGIMTGRATDTALVAWARQVTSIKQNAQLTPSERLKRILAASSQVIGAPSDFAGLDRALRSVGERATVFMRDNISRSIDARLKVIDAAPDGEKDAERSKLLADLEETYKAYVEKGVDYPPKAHETMIALAESLKRTALKIPAAEVEKMKRLLDMSAEKPASFDMAVGIVWERLGTYYDQANARVDAFNNIIDYLDNNSVARLRALNTELRIGSDTGRFKLTVPIPLGRINDRLNASVLGKVGDNLAFKSFNMGQEALSYWSAITTGKDWNESFSNLGAQIFRSRVPGGDIVEAVVMENYTRVAVGFVYLLFPTLAVPEALYGVGLAASEWYVGKWQQWQYDEMVDALYEGAVFKPAKGGTWELERIVYTLPNGKKTEVGRDEIYTLPEKVPHISNILVPQVRTHPTIAMFHELLAKPELSDGQSDVPVWPRKYRNPSLYGQKLWEEYAGEVKNVTRQYFAEVIEELQKRKAFDQGTGEKLVSEIGAELGCGDELLGLVGREREALEAVVANWREWKQTHAALMEFRERYRAYFILDRKPLCKPLSIQVTLESDRKDLQDVLKAAREATVAVEEIVGGNAADEKILQPAIRARAGAYIYVSGSPERRKIIEEYRAYLDSLRQKSVPPSVRIAGPAVVEEGVPAEFTAVLDRNAASVRYDWKFAKGGDGETLSGAKTARMTWTPSGAGEKTLEVHALVDIPGADWVRAIHPVKVLSAEEAPKPTVRLTCPVKAFEAGEAVPITAETVEYGLDGKGFVRYFWYVDGLQVGASADNVFLFDGTGCEGRTVTVKVSARTENKTHIEASLNLDVAHPDSADAGLRVFISPEVSEAALGSMVRLEGVAFPKKGGGSLAYQWSVNGEFAADGTVLLLDTTPFEGRTVEIAFYAAQILDDVILHEGQTRRTIKVVKEVPLSVAIAGYPAAVDDTMNVELCVLKPRDDVSYEWFEWIEPVNRWSGNTISAKRCMLKSARGLSGQKLRFKVTATDAKGLQASAETEFIEVVDPAWEEPLGGEEETAESGEQEDSGAKAEEVQETKPEKAEEISAPKEVPTAPETPTAKQATTEGTWFKSSLAGGWKVEHNMSRLWAARMTREIAGKSDMCRPQTVRGTISAKLESSFVPKPGEIDAKLRYLVENNGFYPDEEGIQSFSIGKYKGRMITTTFKYKNGFGNPMAGYRDGTAHSFGYAIVLHETERRMISVNFSVSAGSCWDNSGKDNALAQVKAARGEALGIIQGLSLHESEQESPVAAGVPVVQVEQADEEKKKEKKYQLTLTRVSPASGPVIVGTPVTYKATLSGDKPEGEVRYQFEPHPDVAFTPHEGPSASTTAVFSVPEKVGVWVTAVDKTGTIATSDQLEIEIQKPVLELAMEPKAPLVGQEVKAKLTVKPEVKDIDFRWMPVPGNAKHVSTSKNNRELIFYLKDEKAAEIQVNARVPFSGEDLGEAKASVAAKKYAVTVSAPKAQGPPPRVWKEGVGLVTVDKAIAVDQIVEFSVALQPEALSGPVKYQWKVENGPCRVSNPSSSVARVTANAAGTCELSVTVRDRNDVELGVGQGSFSASVTQEAISQGEQKAQAGGEAQKLVQNAPAKARKGDYDGAIGDAEDAARLDPKNTAAKALADKLRQEKERIHAQLEKTRKFMEQRRYNEAQKELIVAKNLNGYYPPIHEMEEALRKHWSAWNQEANQKNYEIREAIEKKEFGKALEIAAAWRTSTIIAPNSENELKQNENWARKWQTQKKVQITLLREAGEMVKEYDYAGALKRFEQGFLNWNNVFSGSEPEYREARELQARATKADKRLREIVPLLETVIRTKTRSPADIERGTRLADEAVALQPNNQQFAQWRDMLRDGAGTAPDQGGGAGTASGEQAARELWQEAEKLQLENDYAGALQKYREGLKLHADPAIENRVKTLEKYVAVTKGAKPGASGTSVQPKAPSAEPALPATKQAAAANPGGLAGEWEILSPGYKGKLLILEQSGSRFSGRAYPDQPAHDTVIEGSIDGNTVSFARTGWKQLPNLRQDFTGTLGVDDAGKMVMEGTFASNGKGSTWWMATRLGPVSAVQSAQDKVATPDKEPGKEPVAESPQAAPPSATKGTDAAPAASSINMLGEWNHVGNGHRTKLIVGKQDGNAFSGVMHGNPLINGVVDGNRVTFTRDISLRQDYTGTLTVGPDGAMTMSGTFTQKGSQESYKWSSSKAAPRVGAATAGRQASPPVPPTSTENQTVEAAAVPSGWKAVTIGNVSFAVPASWEHKTMDEPDVETLNLYWDGSFDDPLHGVSGGVTPDYNRAKSDLSNPSTVKLGGASVLRVHDGPAMNLLFPPMSGNRGVALVVFRGPGGNQATIDALLKTFRVNGQAEPASSQPVSPEVSHEVGNIYGVGNGPTNPTVFTLPTPRVLALIQNYHWNFAKGALPGTIALRDANGRSYGPWKAEGSPGQGGVPNAYWTARPMVELPAGSYTVIDSDPGTWAQNSQSGGQGFTRVETLPAGNAVPGDGKALTIGQKYREGMRWVSASNPGHYLERRTTAKGVRWIEHDGGKVLFEFEEKGGSSIHGSVTIFDPSRNISAVLYPDRFEFSRDGRKLGSHQGGWK